MSLFEKLNNKRYNLQESKNRESAPPDGTPGMGGEQEGFTKKNNRKISKRMSQNATNQLDNQINKRRSAELTKSDAINRSMGGGPSTEGTGGANTGTATYKPPSKKKQLEIQNRSIINKLNKGQMPNVSTPKITGDVTPTTSVKQSEVSKDAKKFTDKINKQNKNLTPKKFFDPVKAKKAKDILIAKRKEYGIDRKGNISDAGVKRYAQKTKQLSSGSNLPVTPTKKDLKVAKIRAVGGEKIKDSTGKVIGTTTGKYGGKLSRARNKNMPSYAEVKAKIDAKNPTYRSPITGGKLPNIGSPASQVKKLDPKLYKDAMKLKGKGGIPKWMKDFDKEYPDKSKLGNIQKPPKGSITEPKMPKTILKRVKPDLAYPKGFKPIDTGTKEGQKLYQKQLETGRRLSTKDLTAPTPPKLEPIVKPKGNLFSRLKTRFDNFGKGIRNYLKDPVAPEYRTYTRPDGTVVSTRNRLSKNIAKRTFQKLSKKGKLGAILGAGIIGTSIVSSLLPKKGKGAGAKIPFDPKNYKPVTVKLSLTSGKKDKKGNIIKPPELPVNNNPNVKNLVNRTAQAKKNYKIPKVT